MVALGAGRRGTFSSSRGEAPETNGASTSSQRLSAGAQTGGEGQYGDGCCLTPLSTASTMGLNAPSARWRPITPSCGLQLACWWEGMPARGMLRTSLSSTRPSNNVSDASRGNPKHKQRLGNGDWVNIEVHLSLGVFTS